MHILFHNSDGNTLLENYFLFICNINHFEENAYFSQQKNYRRNWIQEIAYVQVNYEDKFESRIPLTDWTTANVIILAQNHTSTLGLLMLLRLDQTWHEYVINMEENVRPKNISGECVNLYWIFTNNLGLAKVKSEKEKKCQAEFTVNTLSIDHFPVHIYVRCYLNTLWRYHSWSRPPDFFVEILNKIFYTYIWK